MELVYLMSLLAMVFAGIAVALKYIEKLYQEDPTATIISFAFAGIMLLANIIAKVIGDYKEKHDKETKNNC